MVTPVLAAIIAAASVAGIGSTAASAMTIDEHGRVLIKSETISQLLPDSWGPDSPIGLLDSNASCTVNEAAGCGVK
jgi:hypothetical protein